MSTVARINGVHPVEAEEPCYLCEVIVEGGPQQIVFGEFTQPLPGRDRSYWQVPYDERLLSSAEDRRVYAFFFHYLDLEQPLQSPFGSLLLPEPTPRPERLSSMEYQAP